MKGKEYSRCPKIHIYGNDKDVQSSESALDAYIKTAELRISGYRLEDEGKLRLKIQELIDRGLIKATVLVDGNYVYPYQKIIREYDRLRKSGSIAKMTKSFYLFLTMNFDIAHYHKQGFINYYRGDFEFMKHEILDNASTPYWHTDVRRILDYIQMSKKSTEAA